MKLMTGRKIRVDKEEFELFKVFFKTKHDFFIEDSKYGFFESRLNYLLNETESSTFRDLLQKIKKDDSGKLAQGAVDALSISENEWFEDKTFWSFVKEVLMQIVKRNLKFKARQKERLWFIYSGAGDIVYAFTIYLHNYITTVSEMQKDDFMILGTDNSPVNIYLSISGRYDLSTINNKIPVQFLRYFDFKDGDAEVSSVVKKMATFKLLNFSHEEKDPDKNLLKLPRFDFIYVKNKFWHDKDETDENFIKILIKKLYPNGLVWFEKLPGNFIKRYFEKIAYLDHFYFKLLEKYD